MLGNITAKERASTEIQKIYRSFKARNFVLRKLRLRRQSIATIAYVGYNGNRVLMYALLQFSSNAINLSLLCRQTWRRHQLMQQVEESFPGRFLIESFLSQMYRTFILFSYMFLYSFNRRECYSSETSSRDVKLKTNEATAMVTIQFVNTSVSNLFFSLYSCCYATFLSRSPTNVDKSVFERM